jgi:hypothetical protein
MKKKTKISKEWMAVIIHIVIVAVCGLFAFVNFGSSAALTLCAGGGISLLTLGGVVWTTHRMIEKKPIALTASSIVIKYALLGGILYYLTQSMVMDVLWLGFGIATILPSLFIFSLLSEKGLDETEEEL